MSTKITIALDEVPAVITESIKNVLTGHGLALSERVLKEMGRNAAHCVGGLDETPDPDERGAVESSSPEGIPAPCSAVPSAEERLAIGETLRALAFQGTPNRATAPLLAKVGEWLRDVARAELAKKAA